MNLPAVRESLFKDDPTGQQAAQFVFRAACLARQSGKCGMSLCPSFIKAQGGPAQLACVGRDAPEFLAEALKRPDWHCPLGKF